MQVSPDTQSTCSAPEESVHWTDEFFRGAWIDLHLGYREHCDSERESDAIIDFLGLPVGSTIIDIPCGPGDHSIELARRGFVVTGVDLSERIIEHAKSRAARVVPAPNNPPNFVVGDMRSLRLGIEYDALLCMWGSFGYFDSPGDIEQLRTFHRLLKPGGLALIDLVPLEGLLQHFGERNTTVVGSLVVSRNQTYSMDLQSIHSHWTFRKDDESFEYGTTMRFYTVREFTTLLESVGFGELRLFLPETRMDFSFGDARAWALARRL